MAIFVYVTSECLKEAEQHSFKEALNKFEEKVENQQSSSYFDRFPRPYLVKKKFGSYQGRLIAAEEFIEYKNEEHTIIIFLGILIRGSKDYESGFAHAPKEYGDKKFSSRYSREELHSFISSRMQENPPKEKPELSEEESAYFFSPNTERSMENEELICESEKWVSAIIKKPFIDNLNRIFDGVEKTIGQSNDINVLNVPNKEHLKIIFFNIDKGRLIFLADIIDSKLEDFEIKKDDWIKKLKKDNISREDIIKLTRRTYPQYILCDEDLWIELEKDSQSNFALSPEETCVLNSTCKENPFPLFINGRAGSGKSTILQYLFTDYFYRSLSYKSIEFPPAYFTCNPELLRNAKQFVHKLLQCNTHYTSDGKYTSVIKDNKLIESKLNIAFMDFRKYLASLINQSERKHLFSKTNYVNYARFHNLWMEKFGNERKAIKDYGPDVSWHVIRTYIQGINSECYVDIDDYMHMEEKQKSVTIETFKNVYEHVWTWYQKFKEENRLWDDQDIVRFVLEKDLLKAQFSGVFCDEAQDFTRIEMEAILRLSLFSNRKIPKQYISKVPFAFAGDELQTLNPTGFRWDALKAWFTEKFIFSLHTSNHETSLQKLNFCELTHNYRSSKYIVHFSNLIQLFRATRFCIGGLKPQEPWREDSAIQVVHFTPENATFWDGIKKLSDTVFIIPCHEGEELAWIKEDDYLKEYIKIENETPSVPVLSANLSKGLEFKRVVVYGFGGRECPENLLKKVPENEDPAHKLPLEYHINKTYVAVSRARNQLFIVDAEHAIDKLWKFTPEGYDIESLLAKINPRGSTNHDKESLWNEKKLSQLIPGNQSHLQPDFEVNLEETAIQLEASGQSTRNSYMMRQAAQAYKDAGLNDKSKQCEAKSYYYNKSYMKAGEIFDESGWFDGAIECYWLASSKTGYEKIIKLAESQSKYKTQPEYMFSFVFFKNWDISSALAAINCLVENLSQCNINDESVGVWNSCINILVDKISELQLEKIQTKQLYKNLAILQENGFAIKKHTFALAAYNAAMYEEAIDLWNRSKLKKYPNEYRISMAKITKYPDNLRYIAELKDWKWIINEYQKYEKTILSSEAALYISVAFLNSDNEENALTIMPQIRRRQDFDNLLNNHKSKISEPFIHKIEECKDIASINSENWSQIWPVFINIKNKNDFKSSLNLACALARSKSISDLPESSSDNSPSKKGIAEFLREMLLNSVDRIPKTLLFEVGTSVEKAGNRIDALKYYEEIQKRFSYNTEEFNNCLKRWIVCKERQAKFNSSIDLKMSTKQYEEAQEIRKRINMPEDQSIQEHINFESLAPVLERIICYKKTEDITNKIDIIEEDNKEINSLTSINSISNVKENNCDKISFTIEKYKFNYYRTKKRLNIEHNDTGEQISIRNNGDNHSGDWDVSSIISETYGEQKKIENTPICFRKKEDSLNIWLSHLGLTFNFSSSIPDSD